jgi:LacI family transcriptional regulator, repressor for deo operon, udp, cdd, tsx, nupC, and nupG
VLSLPLSDAERELLLGFTTPVRRLAAYREICPEPEPAFETAGRFTVAGGERAMATLLGLPRRPTAVFAASDEMAFGALRPLRRAGLRVLARLSAEKVSQSRTIIGTHLVLRGSTAPPSGR